MNKIIIFILLVSNTCFAQDAVHLQKDDKAPYEGYLTNPSKTRDLYNVGLERDSLKKQLELSQSDNGLLKQEKTILIDQNDKLAKTAYDSQSLSSWEKIGYFALGIITAGGAVYAAKKITQ